MCNFGRNFWAVGRLRQTGLLTMQLDIDCEFENATQHNTTMKTTRDALRIAGMS